jgi:hypothetical protein
MEPKIVPINAIFINGVKCKKKVVERYYFTSVVIALQHTFLKKEILRIWGVAFMNLIYKSKFHNDCDVTANLIGLLKEECGKDESGAVDIQMEALRDCYVYFDSAGKDLKMVVSLSDEYEKYPNALEKLDKFYYSLIKQNDLLAAELMQEIYFSCQRKYIELTKHLNARFLNPFN